MIFEYYRIILRLKQTLPPERFYEIRYENLVADPRGAVLGMYKHFGLPVSDQFAAYLDEQTAKARQYKSRHSYALEDWGLSKDEVSAKLAEVFDAYGFEK